MEQGGELDGSAHAPGQFGLNLAAEYFENRYHDLFRQYVSVYGNDSEGDITAFSSAPEQTYLPLVPLLGKNLTTSFYEGIYPINESQKWQERQVVKQLNAYVESIQNEETKQHLINSIICMVTVEEEF